MSAPQQRTRHHARVRMGPESNPLASMPDLAALSDEAWIEYQLSRYPLSVVLSNIGIPLSAEDRRRAAGEALI